MGVYLYMIHSKAHSLPKTILDALVARRLATIVSFMVLLGWGFASPTALARQSSMPLDDSAIRQMIGTFQQDPRGPYRDIRWFCNDGATVSPQERCPTPGVQRARYRPEVIQLAAERHIFLGQILSTTPFEDFWDVENGNSRLKQYQIERFLRQIDNGWINRRAQFYRGAFQEEDENTWGLAFLAWAAASDERLTSQYFLLRQAAKDLPHAADDNVSQRIRTVSREISDAYPAFLDLRIKIHGQPGREDLNAVRAFRRTHENRLTPELRSKFEQLEADLISRFQRPPMETVLRVARLLPSSSAIRLRVEQRSPEIEGSLSKTQRGFLLANLSRFVREQVMYESASNRVRALDVQNALEEALLAHMADWTPETVREELSRVDVLSNAAFGLGFLEEWEYREAVRQLAALPTDDSVPLVSLEGHIRAARRTMEWGTLTVLKTYDAEVSTYAGFEPLASGFFDEKVRSSILLHLGASIGRLGSFVSLASGTSNQLLDIPNAAQARGLNPGYAKGQLVVVQNAPESVVIDADKIYVFNRPPYDLKPVAGILTVTEGNLVSHVQLLARNLGIPNGVVSSELFQALHAFDGQEVFMAVSPDGAIRMIPAADMTPQESGLFLESARSEARISVPVEWMRLDDARVLNLSDVDATDSGILTGPKAANLGQLKAMFPDHVVNGLVVPFGIFRSHMDQIMPGMDISYWTYLTGTFEEAERLRRSGQSDAMVEAFILDQLAVLRTAIAAISLDEAFVAALREGFRTVLGGELGSIPVFVRSDTNMEDLKDFTGAGLNLTLFNVLDPDLILNGIKRVWASPYSERSYKWRQHYLLNPENVFPSILIIPSVDADVSGVLITKGLSEGTDEDVTVAFSRGVGGAVDGQIAETWLLKQDGGHLLLSPAREPTFRSVPATGGTLNERTAFDRRILTTDNLRDLADMSRSVLTRLPGSPGVETDGPFDVELGLKDGKIWLFQVRPFVENRSAQSSEYLQSITRSTPADMMVSLSSPIQQ